MKTKIDKRIKELRLDVRLTQTDLAKLCSVKQSCVSKWERGETFPDAETIVLLTEIFKVSSDYLLGIVDF